MSEKESSLLSEAIMTQTDVDCLLNDESLNTSEATIGDGAIDSVTLDDNGGASSSLKRRRGKTKLPAQTRDQKRSRTSREKRQIKQKLRKALSMPHSPQTSKTNKTVRSEKDGKTTALTSSAVDVADISQLSNILQSSLSSAFAGLTASLKTGFADLGKLIQDSKRPEAQESGSESRDSGQ